MTYPITITETPHRGEATTWTLYSEAHLAEILAGAQMIRSDYTSWCAENGYYHTHEDADGELVVDADLTGTLEAYLDWLRHDLRSLTVEEAVTE